MNIRFISLSSQLDVIPVSQTIVVAVNGESSGWKALDWAAAEACAQSAPLRIVHVVAPPTVLLDPFCSIGPVWIDPYASLAGALVLEDAVRRVRVVAPDVAVETSLECGTLASTIRDAGRDNALTVIGRGCSRPFGFPSAGWRIARRATGPVAIVALDDQRRSGPSAGRVVLGIDSNAGPASAVEYAFQAAERRGVGLTVIHAFSPPRRPSDEQAGSCPAISNLRRLVAIDDTLQNYQDEHPRVDVRRRFVPGSARAALASESRAAALLVIGAQPRRRGPHPAFGSVGHAALRWAQSPVAIIREPTDRVTRASHR